MKDPRVYLVHILERIERIEQFTRNGRESFLADRMVQDAVIRNFEVMGEAAKRVPDAYRREHPDISWRRIAGLRDVLIHDYEVVDLDQAWRVIDCDLPALKAAILEILPPLDRLEREIADSQNPPGVDYWG